VGRTEAQYHHGDIVGHVTSTMTENLGSAAEFLYQIGFGIAVFAPLVALVFLSISLWQLHRSGYNPIKFWGLIFILTLLINPFSQVFLLEHLDSMRGRALADRAQAAGIIGMDRDQVRALLGEPSETPDYGTGEPQWNYKQMPGYWFGSNFQVFFRSNIVHSIEANDD
jgi:hypothetical protein